ncbi:MAG: hypothetical protein ACOVOC_10095 [Rhabdaerophilum sp.]|jgi:hypothetical protein
MSGIAEMPAMNGAMAATIAVLKAAQAMGANTAGLLATAANPPSGRAPLPYSSVLDKLA